MQLLKTSSRLRAAFAFAIAVVITPTGLVLAETSPPATPAIAKPPIELTCATEPSSITLSSPGVLAAAAATEHKNW